jgi:SPP1 gp7 family putative phage head morphogenesis protein
VTTPVRFNVLAPNVVDGIRALDSRVLANLKDEIRETVRAYVEQGLRDGQSPAAIARGLRDVIGLAPNQLDAVNNFRRMLEEGDREALTRLLRDRRFDAQLEKAFAGDGLSSAQIDKMTDAYRKRMVAFNAETNTRTAALDAQKLANHLSWEEAVASGRIDGGALFKRWATVRDDRVRPEHQAMEGEVVKWDEYYSNGQMVPGESDYNCRCLSVFFTASEPAGARQAGVGFDAVRGLSTLRRAALAQPV